MKFQNAVILAGGVGERFWPLQDKALFPFCGKPLLAYQIETVLQYAEQVFVVTHENKEESVKNLCGSYNKVEMVIQKGTGQAAALLALKDRIQGEALVMNANDVFHQDIFRSVLQEKNSQTADCFLTAKKSDVYFPGGYVKLEGNRVTEVIEKPGAGNEPSQFVRLAVDYFKDVNEFIRSIEETNTEQDDRYEQTLTAFIRKGKSVIYIPYEKDWYPLKYPWHVLSLQKFFLSRVRSHRGSHVTIGKNVEIQGDVYIGNNVKIYGNATIVGPCYIGDNTVIGSYSLIIESAIENDSLIGGYCEVTRSHIGPRVMLHRNYVGDSVLDEKVLMGAGAVLANFRFDEKPVSSVVKGEKISTGFTKFGSIIGNSSKIGVNATIAPGVKIGKNTFIGPASYVDEDVRDNTFLYKGRMEEKL